MFRDTQSLPEGHQRRFCASDGHLPKEHPSGLLGEREPASADIYPHEQTLQSSPSNLGIQRHYQVRPDAAQSVYQIEAGIGAACLYQLLNQA